MSDVGASNIQIIRDMSADDYFADPCVRPSLTQSIAKLLLDRSPGHAWQEHPRLNPNYEDDDEKKFDIGNVAHRLLIGRGKNVARLEFDNWQTKAAKEARAEHRARGILAVLGEQYDRSAAMARAALEQLAGSEFPDAFKEGDGEVVVTWEEGPTCFRTMIDWLASPVLILDYKSSGMSCAPQDVRDRPSVMGWDVQAAFHERALNAVDQDGIGRRRHIYINQEDQPPHALSIVEISESDLTLGRKKLAYALELWQRCMASNQWPLYGVETIKSAPRGYLETKWLDREVEHDERRARETFNPQVIMAG
jgi:hypothetical protein